MLSAAVFGEAACSGVWKRLAGDRCGLAVMYGSDCKRAGSRLRAT